MAYSLRLLVGNLEAMQSRKLSAEEEQMYRMLVGTIMDDLRKWVDEVVKKQEAQDIHYLDASLLANISQIEIMINGTK